MKIIYIPHRGGLMEALEGARAFFDIKDMLEYIVSTWYGAFSINDLYINYEGEDYRLGCDRYMICTRRSFSDDYLELYGAPQALGHCVFYKNLKDLRENAQKYFSKVKK